MMHEEIQAAIEQAIARKEFPDLIRSLRSIDEAELFRGLFPLAVSSQGNAPAYAAAYLLLELEPACELPSEEAVRALVPAWDISIDEVPLYLVTQFGKRELRRVVSIIHEEPGLAEGQRVRIETILYWIRFPMSEIMGSFVRSRGGFLRSLGEGTG